MVPEAGLEPAQRQAPSDFEYNNLLNYTHSQPLDSQRIALSIKGFRVFTIISLLLKMTHYVHYRGHKMGIKRRICYGNTEK